VISTEIVLKSPYIGHRDIWLDSLWEGADFWGGGSFSKVNPDCFYTGAVFRRGGSPHHRRPHSIFYVQEYMEVAY